MMMKIEGTCFSPETNNALYEAGFRFRVKCDFVTLNTIDPWSGMHDIDYNSCVFGGDESDEATAKLFAKIQGSQVERILPHIKTMQEWEEERKAEKAKRAKREAEKAAKAGMTVEEYKKDKAKKAKIRKLEREVAELEAEINEKKAYLKRLKEA